MQASQRILANDARETVFIADGCTFIADGCTFIADVRPFIADGYTLGSVAVKFGK